jgi:hypothetical protein
MLSDEATSRSRLITYKNIYFKNLTGTVRIKLGAEGVITKVK